MTGDKFNVHYCLFSDPTRTLTEPNGPWDTWHDAKVMRDATYMNFPDVQSCWIMVTNPELGLRPKKFGETLKRNKHDRKKSKA